MGSKAKESESIFQKNNLELIKEVSRLKKANGKLNAALLEKTAEITKSEITHRKVMQIVRSIESRNKFCLEKIVEASNELTSNMYLCRDLLCNNVLDLRTPPPSHNASGSGSSIHKPNKANKQLVPPHAVNGHVIQSPTIRIARCHQDLALETNEQEAQIDSNEPQAQLELNDVQDSIQQDAQLELDGVQDSNEPNENLEMEAPSSDEEDIDGNDTFINNVGRRSLNDSLPFDQQFDEEEDNSEGNSNEMLQDQIAALSDIPEVSTEQQQSNTASEAEFSMIVEPSTSLNDSRLPMNESTSSETRRKSIVLRKSIGSPIPQRVTRNSSKKPSSSLAGLSTSGRRLNEEGTNNHDTTCAVSSLESFITESSSHSTPLSLQSGNNRENSRKIYVTQRRGRNQSSLCHPVVALTKFKFSEKENEDQVVNLGRKSNVFKQSEENEQKILSEHEIKKELSSSSRRKSRNTSSPNSVMASGRPKRAAMPKSLREPSLNKKLRRSR